MEFRQSLEALFATEPNDEAAIATLHDRWQEILNKDLNQLDALYALYFQTVAAVLARPASPGILDRLKSFASSSDDLSDLQAYQFIIAFSSTSYLGQHNARQATHFRLLERHPEHLEQIGAAIARPDVAITEKPLPGATGHWGDIVGAMIGLYGCHLASGPQADRLRAEASVHLPGFYRAFPQQNQPHLIALFEDHPDGATEVASLIRFYLLDRGDLASGPMERIFQDMLGRLAERDDFLHKNGTAILSAVMADATSWTADQRRSFIDLAILAPLKLRPTTPAEKGVELKAAMANTRDILARPFVRQGMLSADVLKRSRESQLQRQQEELALVETDFMLWEAKRLEDAVQHVSESPTTLAILKAAAERLPADERQDIATLAKAAHARRAGRKKQFPLPQESDNRFRDLGFKLLVIDELMYRQELLQPKFDVRVFAKEYDGREISVDDDGYEIIPEVETYFRDLVIPDDLLARVETLSQVPWGSPTMLQMMPFFDGGCGDEPMAIGPDAAQDLALLPNLKRIEGLEHSRPGSGLLAALAARDIVISTSDMPDFR